MGDTLLIPLPHNIKYASVSELSDIPHKSCYLLQGAYNWRRTAEEGKPVVADQFQHLKLPTLVPDHISKIDLRHALTEFGVPQNWAMPPPRTFIWAIAVLAEPCRVVHADVVRRRPRDAQATSVVDLI